MFTLKRSYAMDISRVRSVAYHPAQQIIFYPAACLIAVQNLVKSTVRFMQGHQNPVVVLILTQDFRFLISGEECFKGLKAGILVWHVKTLSIISRLAEHSQTITFINTREQLAISGDTANTLCLWEVQSAQIKVLYHFQQSLSKALILQDRKALVCLTKDLLVLDFSCNPALLKSIIEKQRKQNYLDLYQDPPKLLMVVRKAGQQLSIIAEGKSLSNKSFDLLGSKEKIYCVGLLGKREVLLGIKRGIVRLDFTTRKTITALNLDTTPKFIINVDSNLFLFLDSKGINLLWPASMKHKLLITGISSHLNKVVLASEFSEELAALCQFECLKLIRLNDFSEVFSSRVKGVDCTSAVFSYDGRAIISSWSDGCIRFFSPQKGKLLKAIEKAHMCRVNDLQGERNDIILYTGDEQGCIKRWKIWEERIQLQETCRLHRRGIVLMKLQNKYEFLLSCSEEGMVMVKDVLSHSTVLNVLLKEYVADCLFIEKNQILACTNAGSIAHINLALGQVTYQKITNQFTLSAFAITGTKSIMLGGNYGYLACYEQDKKRKFRATGWLKGHCWTVQGIAKLQEGWLSFSSREVFVWSNENKELNELIEKKFYAEEEQQKI